MNNKNKLGRMHFEVDIHFTLNTFSKGLLCDQPCAGYWWCNYRQDKSVFTSLCVCEDTLGLLGKKKSKMTSRGRGNKQTSTMKKQTRGDFESGSLLLLWVWKAFLKETTSRQRSKLEKMFTT